MLKKTVFLISILHIVFFFSQNTKNDSIKLKYVDSLYTTMSLDQKIGQLFIVAAYTNENLNDKQILQLIEKENIGGLIFMQDNVEKQIDLTNQFQKKTKIPLIIGMDAEWDLSMRLKNTFKFPYNMTLGAIENDSLIFQTGKKMAQHCKRIGVHWSFAPVVDVNTNPLNPIIGNRSFGSDINNVSKKGIALMNGFRSENILASAKHFPGHGDTSTDSHKATPLVNHPIQRLDSIELFPYKKLIENKVAGIMVAHLEVPALDGTGKPASLSFPIITDLLKNKMGFTGMVITDALNMQGVANKYPVGIVDLEAFKAGNDVLLFSQNVSLAKEKIKKALDANEIPLDRIEQSVKKILRYKYEVGLTKFDSISKQNIYKDLNDIESTNLKEKLYENAITLVKNEASILPLLDTEKTYYYVALEEKDDKNFLQYAKKYANIRKVYPSNLNTIPANSSIIIACYKSTQSAYSSYKMSEKSIEIIQNLASKNKVNLVLFANPYSLKNINTEKISSIIIGYENNEITQKIIAQQLFGAKAIKGKIPVDVNEIFKYNKGITLESIKKLGYSLPENEGMNGEKLLQIEAIALKSIANKETPGMQVLIAKNGNIIYQKNFGTTVYESNLNVSDSTIYDLASVTKVAATLPFVMKLFEKKKIKLDDPIANYWKESYLTNKQNIKIQELLTHSSGLKNFIPFFKETMENGNYKKTYYADTLKSKFPVFIKKNLYARQNIRDSIREFIINSSLGPKKFEYSDLGFIILQDIIERQFHKGLDELVDTFLSKQMFAKTLTYLPLEKFPKDIIAPTENDLIFRKQQIQGTVHDQSAALMGGVSGNAGLFSSAEDLAKIMQLFLNGGNYGNSIFLDASTVNYFSKFYNKEQSRRALGFDKQLKNEGPFCECVSAEGFGHTGFTGTMVWMDPKNKLQIIILTNRVYPEIGENKLQKNKTRQRIQESVYESLIN